MSLRHSRRQFLRRTTAVTVTAFLPTSRTWATTSTLPHGAIPIPPLADSFDQVQRNRAIYDDLRLFGGKRYAISSVPFRHADWQDHFGAQWLLFVLAKWFYDPHNVLTPGQEIFSF